MTEFIPVSVDEHRPPTEAGGPPTPEEYNELIQSVGWKPRDLGAWQEALDSSIGVAYARDPDTLQLAGAARVVGDPFYRVLYDVVTHPDFQRQGIATRIAGVLSNEFFEKNRKQHPHVESGMLLTSAQAMLQLHRLYRGVGWRPTIRGMVRTDLSAPDPRP